MTTREEDGARLRHLLRDMMKLTPPPLMPPRARMHHRLGAVAFFSSSLVLASGALAVALVVHLQATGDTQATTGTAPGPVSSSPTVSASAPRTSAAALPSACTDASGLTVKPQGFTADMSDYYAIWTITDSGAACSLAGFPAVRAVDQSGATVSGISFETVRGAAATAVSLTASHAEASFYLDYREGGCTNPSQTGSKAGNSLESYTLEVLLPGLTTPVRVPETVDRSCLPDTVTVSAITAGMILPPGFSTGGSPPQPPPSIPAKSPGATP